jgi:hypothetical protein
MSLRDKIFSVDDIAKETVEVPEWGVSVELRAMTAAERAKLGESAMVGDKTDVGLMYALTVIASVYDPETGLPIFTIADKEAILSKSGAVIERLATRALGQSGLTEKAVDQAGVRFPKES